jgi:carnitine O-palmitoyltransferase 1
MAEAHAAVEPLPSLDLRPVIDPSRHRAQLAMTSDGTALFIPAVRFWPRSLLRVVKKTYTKMTLAFMPVPLSAVAATEIGVCLWLLTSKHGSWIRESKLAYLLWDLNERLPFARGASTEAKVAYLTFFPCLASLFLFTLGHRMFLRLLLSYTGWAREARGKVSMKTKIWGALLKYVYMRSTQHPTYAHQTSLPKQPVPAVADTVSRYLAYMKPLMPAADHAELASKGKSFIRNESVTLQRYLKLKTWTSTNYVSDWWLDVVYLRSRGSLLINSNYYGLGLMKESPTVNQAARAANFVWHMMRLKLEIDREQFPIEMANGTVPMCMNQYSLAFSTTREPHPVQDKLTQYDESVSRHIVVMCGGRFYKVKMFCDVTGRLLDRVQIQASLVGIVEARDKALGTNGSFGSATSTPSAEAMIPALTGMGRTRWADIRDRRMLRSRTNRVALKTIESALFTMSFDDENHDMSTGEGITALGRAVMHGNGYNRWLDKSFTVVVSRNGVTALNVEHSWGDAPAICYISDIVGCREMIDRDQQIFSGKDGEIKPSAQQEQQLRDGSLRVYNAERINFHISDDFALEIDEAVVEVKKSIANFGLCAKPFYHFGKGIMKKAGCSPDAFIQMALQLAYFRDQNEFTQTYEACAARLFRDGRTETIRPVSTESCALARAMDDATVAKEEKLKMLRAACEKHTKTSSMCGTGKGVDRHLFAMYVVAVGTSVDSPFLSAVFKRGWKLSTSQIPVPPSAADYSVPSSRYPRAFGGFGPVADDGYGVCYSIQSDDMLMFHVSAKNGCAGTDADRMWARIETALMDFAVLIQQ